MFIVVTEFNSTQRKEHSMKKIATTPETTAVVKNYLQKKALIKALEKEVKTDKATIEALMNDAGVTETVYSDGEANFQLKLTEVPREDVNRKLLKEKFIEVWNMVKTTSSYFRLNVDAISEEEVTDGLTVIAKKKKVVKVGNKTKQTTEQTKLVG